MKEYIEREALLKHLCDDNPSAMEDYYYNAIKEAPAADAVEVVHGEWIEDKINSPNLFDNGETEWEIDVLVCSHCGLTLDWVDYHRTYCEQCGAKMDGERKN